MPGPKTVAIVAGVSATTYLVLDTFFSTLEAGKLTLPGGWQPLG